MNTYDPLDLYHLYSLTLAPLSLEYSKLWACVNIQQNSASGTFLPSIKEASSRF